MAEFTSGGIAADGDVVATWGQEITKLAPAIVELQAQWKDAAPSDRDRLAAAETVVFNRLAFLSNALSHQPATSLTGALTQCVRLICEVSELAGWACENSEGDAQPIADCATRLAYSILHALEHATGQRREDFGAAWSLVPSEDPFAVLRH